MNEIKFRLVRAINQEFAGQTHKSVVDLLNILIEDVREENDTAQGREFISNQGRIAAYKQLRSYLVKPLGKGGSENGKGAGS